MTGAVEFRLNGQAVSVPRRGSLLDALREELDIRSAKDGCSPQGQCGCCTVWVDRQPRVSCVTPVARVAGRDITTVEGLETADAWAARIADCGASQCGFCTPGILMRLAALTDEQRAGRDGVDKAMLAHLCRCTGWQPIVEAAVGFDPTVTAPEPLDTVAAERRAGLEGGVPQSVGPEVALGRGGFADDTAPAGAKVAVRGADGSWVVGDDLFGARELSGKVQGRRTTAPLAHPVPVPAGDWAHTLQTTWVEPAYLEPDASWCEPGGEPMSSHGNGGAFGGKESGVLGAVARRLADEHGTAVRVLHTREDVVRHGAKRPPLGVGVRADGTGAVNIGVTGDGLDDDQLDALRARWPGVTIDTVPVVGPPVSLNLRGAVDAELAAVIAATTQPGPDYTVAAVNGARATARVDDGVHVRVSCGDALDAAVLRSYCIGATHMALGIVRSEGLSIGDDGVPHDLTIRSFGVLRAVDTPAIDIDIDLADAEPVNGSDAVFAAVAAAAWSHAGRPPTWPVERRGQTPS